MLTPAVSGSHVGGRECLLAARVGLPLYWPLCRSPGPEEKLDWKDSVGRVAEWVAKEGGRGRAVRTEVASAGPLPVRAAHSLAVQVVPAPRFSRYPGTPPAGSKEIRETLTPTRRIQCQNLEGQAERRLTLILQSVVRFNSTKPNNIF